MHECSPPWGQKVCKACSVPTVPCSLISTTGRPSLATCTFLILYLYKIRQEDLVTRKVFKHCSSKLTTPCRSQLAPSWFSVFLAVYLSREVCCVRHDILLAWASGSKQCQQGTANKAALTGVNREAKWRRKKNPTVQALYTSWQWCFR